MRNAAELIAAATATGWYKGPELFYVGDGFTVPWQVALAIDLPLGVTFWLYKQYLDAHWYEASRLHDWCYTPYGSLIDVTRQEADSALRELIAVDSPVDAAIVFAAVRIGGGPYFGTSMTGYVGFPTKPSSGRPAGDYPPFVLYPQNPPDLRNMPFTPRTLSGVFTMPIKVVMVFQQATKPGPGAPALGFSPVTRVGGWTEHVWYSGNDLTTLMGMLVGPRTDYAAPLLQARANCLNDQANIVGVRLYQGGAGKGTFVAAGYQGAVTGADQPSSALLCSYIAPGAATARRFELRGIPDGQILLGEFSPSYAYASYVQQYFIALQGFSYFAQPVNTKYPIFNISATGLVTLTGNNPFNVGNIVTFTGALDTSGKRQGGQFLCTAVGPLNQQFTCAAWSAGACTGGTCYSAGAKTTYNFSATQLPTVERIVTRKVGRPFVTYRGRRSRRRVKV